MEGRVKWYNDSKGYGFIETGPGGKDYFMHRNDVLGNFNLDRLQPGTEVTFEPQETERGTKAVKVEIKGVQNA